MPNLAVRAEQAVLGALLQHPDLIDQVGYLSGADFTDSSHKWIFDALTETHALHAEATGERLMTLVADSAPEIDRAYLDTLPARCPVPGHLPAYGRMVAEASMIRELDVHAHRIARGAADLIRRRAGVGTPQQRSIPEHLARLAEAMIRHTRRLDPDRWPEVGPEPQAEQPDQLPEQLQARREIEVLAGLLQHPAQCAQVLKWLPPRAFTPGPHREIYEALRAVARTGAPVDALTVAWQLCMRQAAEDTTGFGEKPTPARSPEPAAAESVFLLAKLPVDPSSAFLAGSLRLADHVSANLPHDLQSPSPGPGPRGPGPAVPGTAPDPPRLPSHAQDPARNGHQPRP